MTGVTLSLTAVAANAITPVGMNAAQSCAAIRAGVSGVRQSRLRAPPLEPLSVAQIPVRSAVRRVDRRWLVRLAARSIRGTLEVMDPESVLPPLVLCLPEESRQHPALVGSNGSDLLDEVERELRRQFSPRSTVLREGHAAGLRALQIAQRHIDDGQPGCLVVGVDSLINATDIEALDAAHRLYDLNQSQGAIPGEAAACLLLARTGPRTAGLGVLSGLGLATETQCIGGDDYATGKALAGAIGAAAEAAGIDEPQFAFRVSDMNGERYRAWESMLAATRYYRTHRENLPHMLPAASVGDTGAASAVLGLVIGLTALRRGYAPGPIGCCEGSSDEGLRAAVAICAIAE